MLPFLASVNLFSHEENSPSGKVEEETSACLTGMQSISTVLFEAAEKYFKGNPCLTRKRQRQEPQKSRFPPLRTKEFEGSQL